jgi:hypothetical protein
LYGHGMYVFFVCIDNTITEVDGLFLQHNTAACQL